MKVLLLQGQISSYNVEVYNLIATKCNLTLGYYDKDQTDGDSLFNKIYLKPIKIGPFVFLKDVHKIAKEFDIVCIMPDLHVVSYCLIPFLPHKYKVANWGIGFRVSYIHPYDVNRKHNFLDWVYKKLLMACDASIFYMEKAKEFWKNDKDFQLDRVFVAPNTTKVESIEIIPENKKSFLFVGTLYKGKGLDILLHYYLEYVKRVSSPYSLVIVGKGEERERLESFVEENDLHSYVHFLGAIYEEKKLAQCFANALLCISPSQAGLSVPKSMGYGVPFVTRKDAITGGEIYHIDNGVNGITYEKDSQLLDILISASEDRGYYIRMGQKAKEYYDNHATIQHRANAVINVFTQMNS